MKAGIFVVYAAVAWVPCLLGGIIVGSVLASPDAEDGVVQGKSHAMGGALPEILGASVAFLVVAYVLPVVLLNRRQR